jgi:tetratricopeptide (TPR) repeat protein
VTDTTPHRDRGALLHDQGRHDLAERAFREHLAAAPDDALAHGLLSLTLVELERLPEADREAQAAVNLAPDEPSSHYARARVQLARRAYKEATEAAREVIRLDPDHPRGYAALAGANLGQGRWREAVDTTDAGLAIAPEHETLLTIRGLALTNLGRRAESRESFEGALRRDPSDSFAHASRGLSLLHEGRMPDALGAFRESLRLDPSNQMAREGLVLALKARNPVYGVLLQGMLFIGRLSGRATLLLYVGFGVLQRTLRELARTQPELQPIVIPLLGIYLFIAWLTFAANPLFNLLLRLDPLGRHALSDDQRLESSIVGAQVAVGIPAAFLAIVTGDSLVIGIAILGLGLVIPTAATFSCEDGWPRMTMAVITMVIAAIGVGGLMATLTRDDEVGLALGIVCLALAGLSSWLAVPLSRVQVRR